MSERPPMNKKKRSIDDALLLSSSAMPPRLLGTTASTTTALLANTTTTSSSSHQQHWQILHQQQQIASLQAELEHERAGRSLDAKKHQHAAERLENRAVFAVREAESARELLRETTEQADQRVQQLTRDRDQALQQNRQLQLQLEQAEQQLEDAEPDAETEHLQRENERLQEQVAEQAQNEEALRREIDEWKAQVQAQLDRAKIKTNTPQNGKVAKLLEEAPSSILKELNQTRRRLADAERQDRQGQRDRAQLLERNRHLVRQVEQHRQTQQRLAVVERELRHRHQQFETARAEQAALREFVRQLHRVVPALKQNDNTTTNSNSNSSNAPPEVATVVRFLETAKRERAAAQQTAAQFKKECEELKQELASSKATSSSGGAESSLSFQQQQRKWEIQVSNVQQQLQAAQQQASLCQREADSLRTLIQTFEKQMEQRSSDNSKEEVSSNGGPVLQATQLQLQTAQDQLKALQGQYDTLTTELTTSKTEHAATQQELARVKDKFGKLRDALMQEKQKAAAAEERAVSAEQLAGKGSFDPARTRVLHLQETPLVQALKEEVAVLKRQLAAAQAARTTATPGSGVKGTTASAAPPIDPDKLNQRLKENFKEQIALFREGVYLMTGFKVDMIPTSDSGRPTFRLRSVFAEQEEDHLLLQWPRGQDKSEVTALDILNTDFAKALAKTPAYEYVTKFHSLPAFLASCQLSLFENQTAEM